MTGMTISWFLSLGVHQQPCWYSGFTNQIQPAIIEGVTFLGGSYPIGNKHIYIYIDFQHLTSTIYRSLPQETITIKPQGYSWVQFWLGLPSTIWGEQPSRVMVIFCTLAILHSHGKWPWLISRWIIDKWVSFHGYVQYQRVCNSYKTVDLWCSKNMRKLRLSIYTASIAFFGR